MSEKIKDNCKLCGRILWLEPVHDKEEELCFECYMAVWNFVNRKKGTQDDQDKDKGRDD